MFDYKYLTLKHLKGFENYKYSAIDTSPLSKYVMHPTWNTIVKFIPRHIAPNLLTFSGFVCMVAAVALVTVLDYDVMSSGAPSWYQSSRGGKMPDWVLTVCGVLLFLAYNLDGVDGKQARKIGVSGPLGELMDHGIDSYIVFLIPFALFSVFGRDEFSVSVFRGYLMVVSIVLNFYTSHWEKYTTGTLYLPWGYDLSMWAPKLLDRFEILFYRWDATLSPAPQPILSKFGMEVACVTGKDIIGYFLPDCEEEEVSSALFVVAGIYGPSVFKYYVFGNINFVQALEVLIHATGLFTTMPVSIFNVYSSYKNGTAIQKSLGEILRPVWSIATMTIVMTVWAIKSPNDILEKDPRAFLFLYGTLFSNIASRLIIAEMSHQRCELICWLFLPLISGLAISFYHPSLEMTMMYCLVAISLVVHVHYGICVIRQLCKHFKVSCFTVPKDKIK